MGRPVANEMRERMPEVSTSTAVEQQIVKMTTGPRDLRHATGVLVELISATLCA